MCGELNVRKPRVRLAVKNAGGSSSFPSQNNHSLNLSFARILHLLRVFILKSRLNKLWLLQARKKADPLLNKSAQIPPPPHRRMTLTSRWCVFFPPSKCKPQKKCFETKNEGIQKESQNPSPETKRVNLVPPGFLSCREAGPYIYRSTALRLGGDSFILSSNIKMNEGPSLRCHTNTARKKSTLHLPATSMYSRTFTLCEKHPPFLISASTPVSPRISQNACVMSVFSAIPASSIPYGGAPAVTPNTRVYLQASLQMIIIRHRTQPL